MTIMALYRFKQDCDMNTAKTWRYARRPHSRHRDGATSDDRVSGADESRASALELNISQRHEMSLDMRYIT